MNVAKIQSELENLAKNPNTSHGILHELSSSEFESVRQCVALNPSTLEATLEDLATDTNKICQAVAANLKTPIYILEQLATYEYWEVRCRVAQNPNTPIYLLKKLGKDKSSDVYLGVLQNPNAPIDWLIEAFDRSEESGLIRYTLAQNPSTPIYILAELARDYNTYICTEVASNPSSSPYILRVLIDGCYSKGDGRYYFDDVLERVLADPRIPLEILERLITEECYQIRCGVAKNPNTPIRLLQQLASDEEEVVRIIASRYIRKT